ncbi:MAG: M20/M25/M40 family metallo-hydrolase [Kiritimatiellae bacterium]|nr:M20/M25/M40 family metallo-hydrolase [Kiritimatiellia bacterium]
MADEQLIQLLRQLVAIPSVNPALADDPAIGSEAPLAQFLADHLAEKGFSIERHEIVPGRPNVVARRGPLRRSAPFSSRHLDTQGIHGMTVPPFSGELRDGRIYGRGACDMKGPMAAALHALTPEVLDALAAAGVQLIFVGAVGEEKGNVGARQLVEWGSGRTRR